MPDVYKMETGGINFITIEPQIASYPRLINMKTLVALHTGFQDAVCFRLQRAPSTQRAHVARGPGLEQLLHLDPPSSRLDFSLYDVRFGPSLRYRICTAIQLTSVIYHKDCAFPLS